MNLKVTMKPLGACPCGGKIFVSGNPPAVAHEPPTCSQFNELEANDFLAYVRKSRDALLRSDAGQAIAEFAAILPVFALVAFMIIDIQWMTRTAAAIEYVVNETARCEAIQSTVCTAPHTPQSYATELARNLRLGTGTELELSTPPCTADVCSVEIRYHYKPLGAWFPIQTINRTGSASVPPQVQP